MKPIFTQSTEQDLNDYKNFIPAVVSLKIIQQQTLIFSCYAL